MTEVEKGAAEATVLYVLGSQRGGTTIVSRTLGTIEGVVHGGELRSFWSAGLQKQRCGCGRSYVDCEVWSHVLRRLDIANPKAVASLQRHAAPAGHAWWHARRTLAAREPYDPESSKGRYTAAVARLYGEFVRASGARVVVDSSKHPGDAALLSRTPGVNLFCVHVVRDPRGTVFDREARRSGRIRHRQERVGRSGTEKAHPLGTAHASLAWLGRHLTSEAVRRSLDENRSLLVRYEDFVADPGATLNAVADMLGVPARWTPISADGVAHLPTAHTPAGGGRLQAKDVAIVEDRGWVSGLRLMDRVVATALTTPRRRRYGYAGRVGVQSTSDVSAGISI